MNQQEETQGNWQRAQQLFAEAIEKPKELRIDFLRSSCKDDQLYAEVATLVEAFDTAAEELERSPIEIDAPISVTPSAETIPGYRLGEKLHSGGQGAVYKALQLGTKRNVAIKFLLAGQFAGEAAMTRFRREIELASRLSHPGIVPVFDCGQIDGQLYYVMQLIEGKQIGRASCRERV